MSSWRDNPIAFELKKPVARDSWWTRPELQTDRRKFQACVVVNEIERLNKRASTFTHDKFTSNKKHGK